MVKKADLEGQVLASGGSSTVAQLQMMRMLMAKQAAASFSTAPVQNLGEGIAQAAGHVADAIRYNKEQKLRHSEMDALFKNEQLQNQNAAAALAHEKDQQAAHQIDFYSKSGMAPDKAFSATFSGLPASTINQSLADDQLAQVHDNKAGMIQQAAANAGVYISTPEARLMAQFNGGGDALSKAIGERFGNSSLLKQALIPLMTPGPDQIDPKTGKPIPGTGVAPIDTAAGQSAYQQYAGRAPVTNAGLAGQYYDNQGKMLENLIKMPTAQHAGYDAQQHSISLGLGNQGTVLDNTHKATDNRFQAPLLQSTLDHNRLGNAATDFQNQGQQQGRSMLAQDMQNPQNIVDPYAMATHGAMLQNLTGANPYPSAMAQLMRLSGGDNTGKYAKDNASNFTKFGQLAPSGASPYEMSPGIGVQGVMPQQGPSLPVIPNGMDGMPPQPSAPPARNIDANQRINFAPSYDPKANKVYLFGMGH